VRAKARIREAAVPYEVPSRADLPDRLETVLQVVYLVFNEGYAASSGESLTRADLSSEAIRLGRLLVELLPEPEAIGLLALMLLHDSRRAARTSPEGELILLEDQDRSLWNREQITEGIALVRGALASHLFSHYALRPPSCSAVAPLRRHGLGSDRGPVRPACPVALTVVELSRAVAVAMRDGPAAGLTLIEAILGRGDLADYHLAHSARAELCRRLGRTAEARASYERALALARQEPERRLLERRLAALPG
jgi:RNA polymerase sigma-70 factor (ECF subfamily)